MRNRTVSERFHSIASKLMCFLSSKTQRNHWCVVVSYTLLDVLLYIYFSYEHRLAMYGEPQTTDCSVEQILTAYMLSMPIIRDIHSCLRLLIRTRLTSSVFSTLQFSEGRLTWCLLPQILLILSSEPDWDRFYCVPENSLL